MSRIVLIAGLLLATPFATARAAGNDRDTGRAFGPPQRFLGAPLHRDALLHEIETNQRKLFGHDPNSPAPAHPNNQFLLVRDRMASEGHEHALGIFTPPGEDQPAHIRDVKASHAMGFGRMIRHLLFADRASDFAAPGGYPDFHLYVNLVPAVPRLHIHAQSGAPTQISDWNAFAKASGYRLEKGAAKTHKVWKWARAGAAPKGWDVLVIADAKLGKPGDLAALAPAKAAHVDGVIGSMWIAAAAHAKGYQIEMSRSDSQIVVRGVK